MERKVMEEFGKKMDALCEPYGGDRCAELFKKCDFLASAAGHEQMFKAVAMRMFDAEDADILCAMCDLICETVKKADIR